MDYPVILHILSYDHDQLHRLVSKVLGQYGVGQKADRRLPMSLLMKATNRFQDYAAVLFSSHFKCKVCELSAHYGNLNALQWARSPNSTMAATEELSSSITTELLPFYWDSRTCSRAAENGHLTLLQWARSQGCPWDTSTCFNAARSGHLEVLQWARSQGCPWDVTTCSYAALNGQLAVLQWASCRSGTRPPRRPGDAGCPL